MVAIKGLTIDFLDDEPTLEKAGYIFYSGFKYGVNKNVQKRIKVNQFFFVRISRHDDPCIGELVSIWKDKFRDTMLSSVRLYFLPEQTPDGRQSNHGQHEVLAASEPVILRLNDLVSWITDEVDWVTGLEVPYSSNKIDPPAFTLPFLNLINKQITLGYHNCNPHHSTNHEIDNDVKMNQVQLEQQSNEEPENQSTIVVLSYPQYCRYRAVLKKMEENFKEKENISVNCKVTKSTLTLPTSLPTSPSNNQTLSTSAIVESDKCKIYPNIRILFCRETFEHEGLLHHDLNCEHLAPKLKGRPRKRGGSSVTMNASAAKTSSHSSSSQDSDTSEENSKQDSSRVRLPRKTSATTNKVKSHEVDCAFQGNRNNVTSKYKSTTSPMSAKLAEKCLKSETEFMKQLNKFMKERNTPITRIPHLGFKKNEKYFSF
uniref:BAH domain-containing protein n=1 Tax=Tetranychus urticae TaxID=32264 RepID=T1KRQ1_TETUR